MILLTILPLAIFLRLYRLGDASLWFDECTVLYWSERINLLNLWKSPYPFPLYFYFIRYWRLLGNTETILRLSSALFGIISVMGVYFLGKLFFGRKTGTLSAFLFAISPFHIYYSQELKVYSLISLLSIMSIYFLFRALKEKKSIFWLGYVIFNALNFYTHITTFFILVAQVIFFIIYIKRYKPLLRQWIIANTVILLFFISWLIVFMNTLRFAIKKFGNWSYITEGPSPVSLQHIFFTLKNFSIGYNAARSIYIPALILFLFFFIWSIVKTKEKEGLKLLLCCLIIPILTVFLIAQCKFWGYADRYVTASSVFFYPIVANGLALFKKKYYISVLCCITILTFFSLKNHYNNYLTSSSFLSPEHYWVVAKKDCKGAANYIIENFREGDVIFHTCAYTIPPLKWYFALKRPELNHEYEIVLRLRPNDPSDRPMPYAYDEKQVEFINYSKKISIENQKRIWLILTWWDFEPLKPSYMNKIREYLDRHYIKNNFKEFNGLIVYLYSHRPMK